MSTCLIYFALDNVYLTLDDAEIANFAGNNTQCFFGENLDEVIESLEQTSVFLF